MLLYFSPTLWPILEDLEIGAPVDGSEMPRVVVHLNTNKCNERHHRQLLTQNKLGVHSHTVASSKRVHTVVTAPSNRTLHARHRNNEHNLQGALYFTGCPPVRDDILKNAAAVAGQ